MHKFEFARIQGIEKIGKGSQGTVYKAPPLSLNANWAFPLVIKKYSKKSLAGNEAAMGVHLQMLIEARAQAPKNVRHIMTQYITWPRFVVYEDGVPCGFGMQLVPKKFFVCYRSIKCEKIVESNFDFILQPSDVRKAWGLTAINAIGRAKIVHDILYIVSTMHSYQFVVGDFSPNNILVYIDSSHQWNNRVLFLEGDSFRKMGQIHPLDQPHTVNYIPPESWTASLRCAELEKNGGDPNEIRALRVQQFTQNTLTDAYKVCLAILRLYHQGDQRTSISDSPIAVKQLLQEISADFADMVTKSINATPNGRSTVEMLFRCFRQSEVYKNAIKTSR